jgi:hypothetical protein
MTIKREPYKNFNKYNLRIREIIGGKTPRLNSKCKIGLRLCGIDRKIPKKKFKFGNFVLSCMFQTYIGHNKVVRVATCRQCPL